MPSWEIKDLETKRNATHILGSTLGKDWLMKAEQTSIHILIS
jgi:hypothetical protein